ncbi:L,D-transpeptidase, partial [Geminicoccaceae bacterium SYSU G07066]
MAICLVIAAVLGAPFQTAAEAKPLVIVNKAINKLALVRDGRIEAVYPVATGVNAALTPEGMFTVTVKAKHP